MRIRLIGLGWVFWQAATLCYGFSGYYGHTLQGALEVSPYYIYSTISPAQNVSNLGSPLAVVDGGIEFSADFDDVFSQHWHLTADVQDNYQVILKETSPTSQANIGASDWMVQWHFTALDFQVGGVQLVAGPEQPWPASIVSYDPENVWIGFHHLYEVPAQGTYTFQIVPVPEPDIPALVGLAAALFFARGRGPFRQSL